VKEIYLPIDRSTRRSKRISLIRPLTQSPIDRRLDCRRARVERWWQLSFAHGATEVVSSPAA
jgi:hypothetical protein